MEENLGKNRQLNNFSQHFFCQLSDIFGSGFTDFFGFYFSEFFGSNLPKFSVLICRFFQLQYTDFFSQILELSKCEHFWQNALKRKNREVGLGWTQKWAHFWAELSTLIFGSIFGSTLIQSTLVTFVKKSTKTLMLSVNQKIFVQARTSSQINYNFIYSLNFLGSDFLVLEDSEEIFPYKYEH